MPSARTEGGTPVARSRHVCGRPRARTPGSRVRSAARSVRWAPWWLPAVRSRSTRASVSHAMGEAPVPLRKRRTKVRQASRALAFEGGGTVVDPDGMETQVDSGGHTCRREDVTVVDEHAVRLDLDAWTAPLELVGHPPMGHGGPSAEETCRRQGECSGADGHDPCAARPGPRSGRRRIPGR